ncbi:hypothetical protein K488DRAFT_10819, partial [Vararia minispora EC-137]
LPSLQTLCVRALVRNVDQLAPYHEYLSRFVSLREQRSNADLHDLLSDLYPVTDSQLSRRPRIATPVDPRLWATVVQVYRDIPGPLRSYSVALSDIHLPLLQSIPSTSSFSLLTVLSLPRSEHLTDSTIVKLKALTGLCALDASETGLSAHGIQRLANTLGWSDVDEEGDSMRNGPWQLRILRLKSCRKIDGGIYSPAGKFPLLSILG